MNMLKSVMLRFVNAGRKYQYILMVIFCLAMFVLAGGAPNATIGIGK
jgi:hypothetical protein